LFILLSVNSKYVTTYLRFVPLSIAAFVYYGADRVNLTVLRRPRPLTRIDLLHSYQTGPVKVSVSVGQSWKPH